MTEEDERLSLLVTEPNTVQAAIRALDTIDFQIKGWSVTASLAIGGFAIAYHRLSLIIVGIGALTGFFLLNCQYKYIAVPDWKIPKEAKLRFERRAYKGILREVRPPITYSLYLFILACLIAEAIFLA
jgi:hypothetical protein